MPSKGTFGLKVLRDAVRRRVDETSIRATAEEIGMSHSGLHVILKGSKPHPKTREKLVAWYLERRKVGNAVGDEISATDVNAALTLLVHYVMQDSRPTARAHRVQEIIERFDVETGGVRSDK